MDMVVQNIENFSRRRSQRPFLSIVAPCYNEEACLPEFYRRVTDAGRQAASEDYEIIFVNDGSRDRTREVMETLVASDPHVVAINLSRNFGHQLALTAGLQACSGARILIIDADLQDPPELLGAMMRKIDEGADVVYGRRSTREGETRFKVLSAKLFYRLLRTMIDVDIPADTGDFRLITRRVLDRLNSMPEHHRFIRGMVSWIGLKQVPLDYERDPRFAGTTEYPLLKMLRFAVDAVTGFSVTPLRTASFLGVALGLGSLMMVIYTLGSWLTGSTVDGWTSLTTIVLIIGSAQLVTLGVIGEYLGRLYMESKQRPLFIVDNVVSQQSSTPIRYDS